MGRSQGKIQPFPGNSNKKTTLIVFLIQLKVLKRGEVYPGS